MAITRSLLSLDEYLRTSYDPDADFVDGQIEERHLGEYEHARLQYILASLFARKEREWNVIGLIEQRILVAPDRVRVCDVCLLDRSAARERVLRTPPLLCVEILSPEDRLSRVEVVFTDYLNMGVQNIWLLDSIRQMAHSFGTMKLQAVNSGHLAIPGTSIDLDLAEAFAAVD